MYYMAQFICIFSLYSLLLLLSKLRHFNCDALTLRLFISCPFDESSLCFSIEEWLPEFTNTNNLELHICKYV